MDKKMETFLDVLATDENFNEAKYLSGNPDVASAIAAGTCKSGELHFLSYGKKEGRMLRDDAGVERLSAGKIARLADRLDLALPHTRNGLKYNFLTDELREETGIVDTHAVSGHGYDGNVKQMIRDFPTGLILDCGAGRRPVYYDNVVNYEIVDYDTTDILGVGERLPFKDDSFDGVVSVAVLEHVRDPFACAAEIARVLRPGGRLFCVVPFLQPEHGYPRHYYNMAPQGLRALFERRLTIDDHRVYASILPVWALRWIVRSWADGLAAQAREDFLSMPLRTFVEWANPQEILSKNWVTELPEQKNFELACATALFAHKPAA
jgi:hypothetical protein